VVVVVFLLAAWQWAVPQLVRTGPEVFPLPSDVVTGFGSLVAGRQFWTSVGVSVGRVLVGFAVAAVVGVALGIAMGVSRRVEGLVDITLEALRPLPAMAWIPIAILWFGVGDLSSVFLVSLGAFFPIVLNAAAGARATSQAYRKAALTLGAPSWLRFRRVTLPGALPYVLLGCRVGLGVGWMVIVSAEMVGAQSGLGFLIMEARSFARIDWVVDCMVVIGLIGIALDTAIERVQRHAAPWWGRVAA
jgi:ABC-type nitrate/sulfonate/bicarbonate transport system permease component